MRPESTQVCPFCKEAGRKDRDEWRSSGLTLTKYARNPRRAELERHEAKNRDDGRMSEGDHQSWGRLF